MIGFKQVVGYFHQHGITTRREDRIAERVARGQLALGHAATGRLAPAGRVRLFGNTDEANLVIVLGPRDETPNRGLHTSA